MINVFYGHRGGSVQCCIEIDDPSCVLCDTSVGFLQQTRGFYSSVPVSFGYLTKPFFSETKG